jgi:hypothetical protein
LQIRLSLARDRTEQTAPDVVPTFSGLIEEAEAVGEELRRIGHGISPPLLATRGLVDALRGACACSGIAVQIAAGDIGLSAPASRPRCTCAASSRSKTRPSTPAAAPR